MALSPDSNGKKMERGYKRSRVTRDDQMFESYKNKYYSIIYKVNRRKKKKKLRICLFTVFYSKKERRTKKKTHTHTHTKNTFGLFFFFF